MKMEKKIFPGKSSEKMNPEQKYGSSFSLKDNTQASKVKPINTNSEQYDLGKIKEYSSGSMGYPSEAWDYDY